jgi:hypothetical protein
MTGMSPKGFTKRPTHVRILALSETIGTTLEGGKNNATEIQNREVGSLHVVDRPGGSMFEYVEPSGPGFSHQTHKPDSPLCSGGEH